MPCIKIARVVVRAATYAIDKPYDYAIGQELEGKVVPGVRVRVSFGRGSRRTEGLVLDVREAEESSLALKEISSVIDDEPIADEKMIKLALWMREQYFCTFFDALKTILPSGVWYKYEGAYAPAPGFSEEEAAALLCEIENGADIARMLFGPAAPCKKQDLLSVFGEKAAERALEILIRQNAVEAADFAVKNISDKTERLVRLGVSWEEVLSYISRKKPREAVKVALEFLKEAGAVSVKELCYFTGASAAQITTLNKNGIVEFDRVEVYRRPKLSGVRKKSEIELNDEQTTALSEIKERLSEAPACALIRGVTGSGKTAVYFKLIEHVISQGKKAILLVPEISLTPQLLELVYSYFGERTAILHSALSTGERYDEWKRIRNGEVDIVVGTRSAIFAPLSDIGVIILDEEQEATYKSSSNPHYHARDIAKFRCVAEKALLLLGSATPSVESMYYAKSGKYSLHELESRYNEKPLPKVIISDMRKTVAAGRDSAIGEELYAELSKNIKNGEQSILFINRRGASKYALCNDCGEIPTCENCSVPLVYHSANKRLMCHHCGYSVSANESCSACGGRVRFVGFGTQRIEEELSELFPGVGVIRMDTDTTSAKASHEKLLSKFKSENIPILLGTQMITKGLDFENVTLVGVVAADQAMFSENFKASENAFSLITQVVGRSGRGEKEGRAVIQTFRPGNPLIQAAARQDYEGFYEKEIEFRKSRSLPPFCDIISLLVLGENETAVLNSCMKLCEKIKFALGGEYSDIKARVLGPTPAEILKIGGKFRYKISISAVNNKRIRELVSRLLRDFVKEKENKLLGIIPDINTTDF